VHAPEVPGHRSAVAALGTPAGHPSAAAALGTPAPGEPTQFEIAERAYQLYVDRGSELDSDFEDWIRAERELRGARGLK